MSILRAFGILYRGFRVCCPKIKCLTHAHAYNCPSNLKKWHVQLSPEAINGHHAYPFYSVDLCWRVVWMHLAHNKSPADIAQLLCISERTVRRYLTLFYQTGDVEPRPHTNGPKKLLGNFDQLILLQLILAYLGIYLHELQSELHKMFGVTVSSCTICKTLKFMGCTRQCMHHIALQ